MDKNYVNWQPSTNFTKISNEVIRSGEKFSPAERVVLSALMSCTPCFPGYKKIKEWTGYGHTTISKTIGNLRARNIIWYRKGWRSKRSNYYVILPPEFWDRPVSENVIVHYLNTNKTPLTKTTLMISETESGGKVALNSDFLGSNEVESDPAFSGDFNIAREAFKKGAVTDSNIPLYEIPGYSEFLKNWKTYIPTPKTPEIGGNI